MFKPNVKSMFVINGFELRSRNNSETTKAISLHDLDGSMLAGYPLATACDNYKGIDDCMIELHRFLLPTRKLVFTKKDKSIEITLHWSKEYNQYRITSNKPDSKYKPSTAYEDSLTAARETIKAIVKRMIDIDTMYTDRIIDRLKVNVSTKRLDNMW